MSEVWNITAVLLLWATKYALDRCDHTPVASSPVGFFKPFTKSHLQLIVLALDYPGER